MKEKIRYLVYYFAYQSAKFGPVENGLSNAGFVIGFLLVGMWMYLFILCKILAFYGLMDLTFMTKVVVTMTSNPIHNITFLMYCINAISFLGVHIYYSYFQTYEYWEDIIDEIESEDKDIDNRYWKATGIMLASIVFCVSSFMISNYIPLIINHL